MAGGIQQSGTQSTMSEINVTPFVDVMLVLLIIFMVVAPKLERGMAVKLPVIPEEATTSLSVDEDLIVAIDNKGNVYVGELELPLDKLAGTIAGK